MTAALPRVLGLAAALGALACFAGALWDARTLLAVYLPVAVTAVAVPSGCLGVLMISYLTPGRWAEELYRPLATAALATPFVGLLLLPVLASLPWLYPWMEVAPRAAFKAFYLTPALFVLRTALYVATWSFLAVWMHRVHGDRRAMRRAASVGLIAFALTGSLAGIDWLESVNPEFHSSIYGLLFLTFQVLAGYTFALVVFLLGEQPARERLATHGAILLSALLLWAYNHAMQYIIVWSGNIPKEAVWYLDRSNHGWGWVFGGLILLQFVVPFLAMLSSQARASRAALLWIGGATLSLRFVEATLLVLPDLQARGASLMLDVPATILFVTSLGLLAFIYCGERVRLRAPSGGHRPEQLGQRV